VYENLDDVTLVQGGISASGLKRMIELHDQVMMMGHGSSWGLLSVGQFENPLAIDGSFSEVLAEKDNSVFIWCNADKYVKHHGLGGFYTGMFISDTWEAWMMGVDDATSSDVKESNTAFAETVGSQLHHGPKRMHFTVTRKYGRLAKRNPVARYNHKRLFVT
jgi:hypothetical protein